MTHKNKNLRAFLYQNPRPTIEQTWDAAWSRAQKTFHARSMQEMRGQVDRLREALEDALEAWNYGESVNQTDAYGNARNLLMELEKVS